MSRKQEQEKNKKVRAALYIRVSSEEQALHGYSLAAQRDALTRYAHDNGLFIVDYYVDEGLSARKKYSKRKEFMRMLDDVKRGQIDLILFIKLDRWFRSIADYYKIQEILEAHGVNWKATEEHYDTTTANGRLHINIRLSVAQDESDRNSERIKFVFDNKVSRGEVLTGSCPLGFRIQEKQLVHDDNTAGLARDVFTHYALHNNKSATRQYIKEQYGVAISEGSLRKMLCNPLYKGMYRNNPAYCPPLVEPELFDRVQQASRQNVRATPAGRVYLLSGLVTCGDCGHKMVGRYGKYANTEYYYYRCNQAANHAACGNRRNISEAALEAWLLKAVEAETASYTATYAVGPGEAPKAHFDRAGIRHKMEKLKELYVNDLISLEEYKADYQLYSFQLTAGTKAKESQTDSPLLHSLLANDLRTVYTCLGREGRRALWRSAVKEIRVSSSHRLTIFFA